MCDPVTLTVAATAIAAAGQGIGALQQRAQLQYQAKIADRNAKLEAEAANTQQQATREAALKHYREVGKLKGQQQAAMAANGIVADFGSAADIAADTEMLSREDVSRLYKRDEQAVRGFDIASSNYSSQAGALRSAGTAALVQGAAEIGSTVLGGASQYNKMKAGRSGAAG